jgi:hypothetical protein
LRSQQAAPGDAALIEPLWLGCRRAHAVKVAGSAARALGPTQAQADALTERA